MNPDDHRADMLITTERIWAVNAATYAHLMQTIAAALAELARVCAPVIAALREFAAWYYPEQPRVHIYRRMHRRPRGRKRHRGMRRR